MATKKMIKVSNENKGIIEKVIDENDPIIILKKEFALKVAEIKNQQKSVYFVNSIDKIIEQLLTLKSDPKGISSCVVKVRRSTDKAYTSLEMFLKE